MAAVRESGTAEVPLHLRNAPTRLMKQMNYGKEYRYAHDEPEAYPAGEQYFPSDMQNQSFYFLPTGRGLKERLAKDYPTCANLIKKPKKSGNSSSRPNYFSENKNVVARLRRH